MIVIASNDEESQNVERNIATVILNRKIFQILALMFHIQSLLCNNK